MNAHTPPNVSRDLEAHIHALNNAVPSDHAVEAAQIKLERALVERSRSVERAQPPRRTRWIAFAATACAALALILVPFLVSERGGLAFAEVQRHFQEFRTLAMTVEEAGSGIPMPKISVMLDDTGNVRTDVGSEISVVVNATQGQVLMLMHGAKSAMRFPVDIGPALPAKEALSWIDELRHFKGIATALSETRLIDGETAHGWSLKIADAEIQLWARDDGLPLAMSVGQGLGIDLRFRFDFDTPIDPAHLSTEIPSGYSVGFGG